MAAWSGCPRGFPSQQWGLKALMLIQTWRMGDSGFLAWEPTVQLTGQPGGAAGHGVESRGAGAEHHTDPGF